MNLLDIDFLLNHVQPIIGGLSLVATGVVVWRKKHSNKLQKAFLTTQFKKRFKQHSIHFNDQFKSGNNTLFK